MLFSLIILLVSLVYGEALDDFKTAHEALAFETRCGFTEKLRVLKPNYLIIPSWFPDPDVWGTETVIIARVNGKAIIEEKMELQIQTDELSDFVFPKNVVSARCTKHGIEVTESSTGDRVVLKKFHFYKNGLRRSTPIF